LGPPSKKKSTPTKDDRRQIDSGSDGVVRKDGQIPRRETGIAQDSIDRPSQEIHYSHPILIARKDD
jgi:hypothetical protein